MSNVEMGWFGVVMVTQSHRASAADAVSGLRESRGSLIRRLLKIHWHIRPYAARDVS